MNNISSKMAITLIASPEPFWKHEAAPGVEQEIKRTDPDAWAEFKDAFAKYDKTIFKELTDSGIRTIGVELMKHLVVAGNAVLDTPNKEDVRLFGLGDFVVRRAGDGQVLELVVKETIAFESLDEEDRDRIMSDPEAKKNINDEQIDLFSTMKLRDDGRLEYWQEAGDIVLTDSEFDTPASDPHYLVLRATKIDGEDYGRGYVEDYLGDLTMLDALSEAIGEGSLAASKVLFGVRPDASVTAKELEKLNNLGFFEGEDGDVWTVGVDKANDFRVALEVIRDLRRDLGYSFLLNSSVPRQAERVTAEEIRFVAQELEDALGGIYSVLVMELQKPLVERMKRRLIARGELQELSEQSSKLTVLTGFDALGKAQQVSKIERTLGQFSALFGPEAIPQVVSPERTFEALARHNGVDTEEIALTEEERQRNQQIALQRQAAETVGPEAVRQIGNAVQNQQAQ